MARICHWVIGGPSSDECWPWVLPSSPRSCHCTHVAQTHQESVTYCRSKGLPGTLGLAPPQPCRARNFAGGQHGLAQVLQEGDPDQPRELQHRSNTRKHGTRFLQKFCTLTRLFGHIHFQCRTFAVSKHQRSGRMFPFVSIRWLMGRIRLSVSVRARVEVLSAKRTPRREKRAACPIPMLPCFTADYR